MGRSNRVLKLQECVVNLGVCAIDMELTQMPWRCIHTFIGHQGWAAGVNSVAFAPDGHIFASGSDDQTIVSASHDKTVKLWRSD
jgi:WD40 repeat protein